MKDNQREPVGAAACLLAVAVLASCGGGPSSETPSGAPPEEEICAASLDWLPDPPAPELYKPLPHPASECPFYRAGWQNFLIATQPDATGAPALRSYPTVSDVFVSARPRPQQRSWLGDIKQAGGRQILIDQNGRPIYYGIHVNQAYVDFIRANHLETAPAIKAASPSLFFPAGVVELKSAWQEVAEGEADSPASGYITARVSVPHLRQEGGHIVEDRANPREVTARLLALHVVFTLPGHPEFVWATFEHSSGAPDTRAADGKRDVAPAGVRNPLFTDPNNQNDAAVVSLAPHRLFRAGTAANLANLAIAEPELALDEATQSFPGRQTSIYRMFPASKANTIDPDDAISSLNHNVEALFARAASAGTLARGDQRGNYRLVGALWMDKPEHLRNDSPIQNDETSPFANRPGFIEDLQANGSDSDLSLLAGEDRLSSTAMESFTQAPDSFPNCFSCHNTQAVTAKGVPLDRDRSGVKLLEPKLINVSHVLSQFLLEEGP